jgi:hypothetical protein
MHLPALITPATLFVTAGQNIIYKMTQVPCLDIVTIDPSAGINQPHLVTYSVPLNDSDQDAQMFLGPRSIIARIATATATKGDILPISPPFTNASYSQQFYGPIVKCNDANSTISLIVDTYIQGFMATSQGLNITETINGYFAFVPDLSDPNGAVTFSGVDSITTILEDRLLRPANASNQIWIGFLAYATGSGCLNPAEIERRYIVCELYNASYSVNFTFVDGSQTITDTGTEVLNKVEYPVVMAGVKSDMAQHSYSAVMWAVSDQLVGSMGIYTQAIAVPATYAASKKKRTWNATTPGAISVANFSEITTQLEHTSLLGSSDLDVFFDMSHALTYGPKNCSISAQRSQDIGAARNRTLSEMIKELSFNTTLSLLNENLLAYVAPHFLHLSMPTPQSSSL